jgi:outer membrane receptor protein involved in Fe transport
MGKAMYRISALLAALLIVTAATLAAQPTGKISGRVTERGTGEALAGVNVIVAELSGVGTSTDANGEYFILQVPPGTYSLRATYIGFSSVTTTDVTVRSELTTRVDFRMQEEIIAGEEVIVVADDPIVRHDITSTRRSASREEMQATPGMEAALDVFRMQGGAVVDVAPQQINLGDGQTLQIRDESVKNVHVRGGRGGEILFMVDGMPVNHPLYGGRSVLELNVNDVEQVELLTGAFNAEYGQAQSGVVNITTRAGSERYEGGVEYRTDEFGGLSESYDTQYLSLYAGGPEPLLTRLLPGRTTFFVSANGNLTNTAYNNRRTRDSFSAFGLELPERQDNTVNLNARLDWRASNALRLGVAYNGTRKRWSGYNWLWDNFPDHTAIHERTNHNLSLRLNHTLSNSTFYSVRLGFLGVSYGASLDGARPGDFWAIYPDSAAFADDRPVTYQTWEQDFGGQPFRIRRTIEPPTFDPLTGFFNGQGYENMWRDDATRTYTFKADLSSQVHPRHFIKTGIELQYHDLDYVDIQDGGTQLSPYGELKYRGRSTTGAVQPPGPFPEFGQNRWVFHSRPLIGGVYVQDKFELDYLIINAGVRLDGFMPGASVMSDEWKSQWERATGLDADWSWLRLAVSPRFGISYPISLKTVIFFSYGHFSQLPELQFYYRDPYTGGLTGNPHLDYEQTILYEFGFTHELATNWALDVKSYAKDISQQVGTTQLQAALGLPVALYDNNGYARARGLEFIVNKRLSSFTHGNLTYTVQWANGYASSAFEDYIRSRNDFPNPIRERRLGWDVRHQVVFQGGLSSPKGQRLEVFGLRLPDQWDVTVLSRLSSGRPYTPGTNDPALLQVLENTATANPVYSTDIKFRKSFSLFGRLQTALFLDVFNVFNQHNIQIDFGFNNWTGQPFRYGDAFQDSNRGYSWYDMYRLMDPRQFSTGRYAKVGLSATF